MATYVNDLRLKEIATGDESGTWGTSTNTNLELIGEALSFGTEAITTNADTHTTTVADGASDPGRAMYLKYTGTLDSACTITIAPNTISRMQFIENGTSGSQNIIISQGSGANITIPPGDTKAVYLDGAGSGAAVVDAFASLSVVDLKVQDDLTVTDDLIVNGDIDLEGSIDVNGTANLDVVDIDGAVDMASTLSVSGTTTMTNASNATQLILQSTDADSSSGPVLELFRNSSSPADNDATGLIYFYGENDASEKIAYGQIFTQMKDVTDGTEDGSIEFYTLMGGASTSKLLINSTETVFNEGSADVDFRVESDGNTHMLFVDAGNDRVGIGTSSPDSPLEIQAATNSSSDTTYLKLFNAGENVGHIDFENGNGSLARITGTKTGAGASANDGILAFNTATDASLSEAMRIDSSGRLLINRTSTTGSLSLESQAPSGFSVGSGFHSASTQSTIEFKDTNTTANYKVRIGSETDDMVLFAGGSERMRIDSSGNVGIGDTSPDAALNIERSTNYVLTNSGRAENGIHIQSGSAGSGEYGGAISFTCGNLGSAAVAAVNDGGSDNDSVGLAFITHSSSTGSVDAAEVARFDENGNFGIGTVSPTTRLDISPPDNTTANKITFSTGLVRANGNDVIAGGFDSEFVTRDGNVNTGAFIRVIDTNTNGSFPTTVRGGVLSFGTVDGITSSSADASEKMRIDSSGRVGINRTPAITNSKLEVGGADNVPLINVEASGSTAGIGIGSGHFQFYTGTTERMRITSTGRLLVGGTSDNSYVLNVNAAAGNKGIHVDNISFNSDNGAFRTSPSGNTSYRAGVYLNSGGTTVGKIEVTSANTTYTTSSDYRLKENITTLENGLDRLNQLKPVKFNWIEDGKEEEGFIAHEVSEIFSDAVVGEKDAVQDNGKISPQTMDYGRITPLLVKAIQEQQEQIEQLKTQIETLQ